MKRLVIFFLLLSVGLSLPLWSSSSALSQKEELKEIVQELKSLNEEQETIIQNSQKRNEELEKLSKTQQQQIETLTELSENKQKTIDEQEKTINELQSLSAGQSKSSVLTIIENFFAYLASFCIGCLIGVIFL